jgi:hypothetical protein
LEAPFDSTEGGKAGSKQLKAEEESWDQLALAIAKAQKAV